MRFERKALLCSDYCQALFLRVST